ncbi:uncharacterized protein F5891DRAFT_1033250 [Suillus fuscotomentosus]|uniref:Uncharacterized protein n=1 Tax=Suillus fuscotomentosus TaxID=1912939 RepID=A0AAD4HCF6_9AGAM|nr:uncharacterized protein F5891DRAFT_1070254 [Suillus fuscotomentosus]XP_041226259.1 uncharacterized protein F5891DRAFT_1033250 [Suillus fuscotomentosus]KAG1891585.1 hypothetical protein F5891DRAFT_1070254 [Suillus fuscotomentosus]KAG1900683.1 hypothetical protein F5891DRAFT_1033250 [Suillus fuscotomentosus]
MSLVLIGLVAVGPAGEVSNAPLASEDGEELGSVTMSISPIKWGPWKPGQWQHLTNLNHVCTLESRSDWLMVQCRIYGRVTVI